MPRIASSTTIPVAASSTRSAAREPGNTVKVAAGIYDMSGVDPETFLFGVIHAQGGYEPGGHFDVQDRGRISRPSSSASIRSIARR